MTKVVGNEATLKAWLEAEAKVNLNKPEGITREEFATLRGISKTKAREVLNKLCDAGLATKIKWRYAYIYQLK